MVAVLYLTDVRYRGEALSRSKGAVDKFKELLEREYRALQLGGGSALAAKNGIRVVGSVEDLERLVGVKLKPHKMSDQHYVFETKPNLPISLGDYEIGNAFPPFPVQALK